MFRQLPRVLQGRCAVCGDQVFFRCTSSVGKLWEFQIQSRNSDLVKLVPIQPKHWLDAISWIFPNKGFVKGTSPPSLWSCVMLLLQSLLQASWKYNCWRIKNQSIWWCVFFNKYGLLQHTLCVYVSRRAVSRKLTCSTGQGKCRISLQVILRLCHHSNVSLTPDSDGLQAMPLPGLPQGQTRVVP